MNCQKCNRYINESAEEWMLLPVNDNGDVDYTNGTNIKVCPTCFDESLDDFLLACGDEDITVDSEFDEFVI